MEREESNKYKRQRENGYRERSNQERDHFESRVIISNQERSFQIERVENHFKSRE